MHVTISAAVAIHAAVANRRQCLGGVWPPLPTCGAHHSTVERSHTSGLANPSCPPTRVARFLSGRIVGRWQLLPLSQSQTFNFAISGIQAFPGLPSEGVRHGFLAVTVACSVLVRSVACGFLTCQISVNLFADMYQLRILRDANSKYISF